MYGDYDLAYCNVVSFDYRYAAKTGVITYDGAEPNDSERAAELRARLRSGPRFVLAVFDTSHSRNQLDHHSTERAILSYRTVLEMVRKNPDWGCLIKSKSKAYDEIPLTDGVQDVVSLLEAEGRCLRLPNETKPSLVASAADAVVGFGVNSAAFTAALITRRPLLNFDPN